MSLFKKKRTWNARMLYFCYYLKDNDFLFFLFFLYQNIQQNEISLNSCVNIVSMICSLNFPAVKLSQNCLEKKKNKK